ncbi:MAG: hypothetical protein C4346_02570, partial [Chloroflexota bacterium]
MLADLASFVSPDRIGHRVTIQRRSLGQRSRRRIPFDGTIFSGPDASFSDVTPVARCGKTIMS